jgi:hypothetical protein
MLISFLWWVACTYLQIAWDAGLSEMARCGILPGSAKTEAIFGISRYNRSRGSDDIYCRDSD